jgi:hypothetical protein
MVPRSSPPTVRLPHRWRQRGERGAHLKQADLDAYLSGYGEGHEAAIAAQVTKGKNAMPSFLGKLSDTDIADVAAYVEQQAGNGWT